MHFDFEVLAKGMCMAIIFRRLLELSDMSIEERIELIPSSETPLLAATC